MQNSFVPFWAEEKSVEKAASDIIFGFSLEQYRNHIPQFLKLHPPPDHPLRILDFGCGLGRFLYHAGWQHPNWTIIGYDNRSMIDKAKRLWKLPPNTILTDQWDFVLSQRFDLINAEIVLMHVLEADARTYLNQFRTLLQNDDGQRQRPGEGNFLGFFHASRETLDDGRTNVWDLCFDAGFEVQQKYYGDFHSGRPEANAAAMLY